MSSTLALFQVHEPEKGKLRTPFLNSCSIQKQNNRYSELQRNSTAVVKRFLTLQCFNRCFIKLYITSGFWPRVRARALRAPVFLGSPPSPIALSVYYEELSSFHHFAKRTKKFSFHGPTEALKRVQYITVLWCSTVHNTHFTTEAMRYNVPAAPLLLQLH